ncbi:MAG: cytochrome c oxidase subunit II [Acidimicrobiales bacterium]|jgi:cytochrome c oxidase subunit 2|nr:cytochrome c oxidase subunit II [Acidimicrobiales bacterium]
MSKHNDLPTDPASRRGRGWARPLRLAGLAGGAALLAGCGIEQEQAFELLGLPEPASEQAFLTGDLWVGTWIAALVVGALVWGLIAWTSIVYRRKRHHDHMPEQTRYNIPIETLYTVVPLFIIGVLFFWTFQNGDQVLAKEPNPDVRIGVIGQQWSWTFNYIDEDVYDVGTAATIPQLYLPVDQRVEFQLNSPDVIHSFWIPSFYFKMDLIPGRTNSFQVTPNREGTYAGRCSELCGTYHSRMLFEVVVVSQQEYDAHMAELEAKGQTGLVEVPGRATFDPERVTTAPVSGSGGEE